MGMLTSTANRMQSGRSGHGTARAACIIGLLFAAVSAYWGLGGRWLLDTLDSRIQEQALAGSAGIYVAVWAAAVLKVVAALLPLLALRGLANRRWSRTVWFLAWAAAVILTGYGLMQTTIGLLAQAGVIHAPATASARVLAWGAYVWDPWFLIWGLLAGSALLRGRHHGNPPPLHV